MLFSNLEFLLLFFAVTLAVYYIFPRRMGNVVLLVMSIIFYGWGEPIYLFLMLGTIIVDWMFGFICEGGKEKRSARIGLVVAVVLNLSVLGFFKYYGFFADILEDIIGASVLPDIKVSLPVGISFYTFQALSYVVDVYRGDAEKQKSPISFGAYVSVFPQLIAGPIVRYKDIAEQLKFRAHNIDKFSSGIRRFIIGFAKKVVLADTAGAMWAYFRDLPENGLSTVSAWLGIIFFSFQIYFDFSGYSDMAIGLGRMFGFEFMENFNYPYIAKSITDFWRRWHISLSQWFRDYVYIPLGGNRVKLPRQILNLSVVWLLTGLWHGADWGFVLWGVYYGVLLILEKFVFGKLIAKLPSAVTHGYTLFAVVFGWFIFATPDMSSPISYLSSMFSFISGKNDSYDIMRSIALILILSVFSTPLFKNILSRIRTKLGDSFMIFEAFALVLIFVFALAFSVAADYSPFLYFRF